MIALGARTRSQLRRGRRIEWLQQRLSGDSPRDANSAETRRAPVLAGASSPVSSLRGTDDVDGNFETVRLLRSQLRNKGPFRGDRRRRAGSGRRGRRSSRSPPQRHRRRQPPPPPGSMPWPTIPVAGVRQGLRRQGLEKIGEDMQQPLIVTGTVLFRPQSAQRLRAAGARDVRLARPPSGRAGTHVHGTQGFHPAPSSIFIDGRTGETLHTETFREEILYNATEHPRPCRGIFELMDRLLPSFLHTP